MINKLFSKTSFKLSGMVGIIILLLGITVLFGTYQMSKVSSEVVNISQTYEPLQNVLGEIRYQQAKQSGSFEKIQHQNPGTSDSEQAREEFWSSNILIKSNIQQGKKIAEAGYAFASTENSGNNFRVIYNDLKEIEQSHDEFEQMSKDAISSGQYGEIILKQLAVKNDQIQNKVESAITEIKKFNDQSISAIEGYEQVWLFVQISIVVVVGIIAVFMRYFIGQINRDLKNEIEYKTKELQEANKKLREVDVMKNEFISIASHELKSPIQPIFGFAELAQSGDIDQKEAWDGVTLLARKLQDLANDVLDVTRIESNRLTLHQERLPINELILETTRMTRASLSKDIKIVEDLDKNVEIEVDRTRVEQVLRNLIGNAVKFTDDGTITVKTRVDETAGNITVTVSDTGLGIPDDVLPNIFGKFVTKGHRSENQSGNGLGLFLCKGIIEAHGGEITAKNNKDGGATFEFTLPLVKRVVESLVN